MPVHTLKHISQGVILGIWRIDEDLDELLGSAMLSSLEMRTFASFGSEVRKKQWLSYRRLIQQIVGEDYVLVYDEAGKPHLEEPWRYISISHSGSYSAVLVSSNGPVGIDIECIHPKIDRIATKFMDKEELAWIDPNCRIDQLFVCWAVKESVYKVFGKGGVDFCDHIRISPFVVDKSGWVTALLSVGGFSRRYAVRYEQIDCYMLAFVVDENSENLQ